MRKFISNFLLALPGLIAAIDRWGGRLMDLIGLPDAARQLENWRIEYFPDIGAGTYWLIGFSIIGIVFLNALWPKSVTRETSPQTPDQEQEPERTFIKAPGSSGLRLFGNIFRGNRTHVDASGATDFSAAGNVHSEGEPTPQRIPILEIRDTATEMGWDFYGIGSLHLLDFIHGLRQAAQDGEITFWGRPDRNDFESLTKDELLQKIPGSHFIDFKIDVIGMASHLDGGPIPNDNFDTRTSGLALGDREKCYRDLHVDREPALRWLSNDAERYKGHNKSAMVPLRDAATEAYEQLKDTLVMQVIERLPSFDRAGLLGYLAHKIVDNSVPVFGRHPPSRKLEQIPTERAAQYGFNDDATEMFDQYQPKNRYTDLVIKRADLGRRISELIAENGN